MSFFSAVLTLLLVMDPVGNIPIFLALLRPFPKKRRYWIILRESLIGFVTLVLFLLFGDYILKALGVTESALGIAGGIVLFIISIRMIFPESKERKTDEIASEPFIVPLAIPLFAGPSAMAVVLLLSTHNPDLMGTWFMVVLIASVLFILLMLSATWFMRLLGERTIIALERLTGMLINVIAVQMLLDGINHYFRLNH